MDTADQRRALAVAAAVVVFFGLAGVYAWVHSPEEGSALDQLGPWTGALGLVLALVSTAWVWWPAYRAPPQDPPSGSATKDEPRLRLTPALAPRLFSASRRLRRR